MLAALNIITVQQQPQILNRRPGAAIVQVDKQHLLLPAEDVAGVTVTMNPQGVHLASVFDPTGAVVYKIGNQRVPCRSKVVWNPSIFRKEPIVMLNARKNRHGRAMVEGLSVTNIVELAQPLAKAVQGICHAGVGRLPTPLLKHGKQKVLTATQRIAGGHSHGRHDRNIRVEQLAGKLMLFPDLGFAPATRAVKLGDHRWLVFNANLVNTVLVAVEGK